MTGLQFTHGSTSSIASGGGYQLNGLHTSSGGNYLSLARDPMLFEQDQLSINVAFKAATAGKGGAVVEVTVSIGVTGGRSGDTIESVLDRANASRHIAQQAGRNRVAAA